MDGSEAVANIVSDMVTGSISARSTSISSEKGRLAQLALMMGSTQKPRILLLGKIDQYVPYPPLS